MRNRTARYSPQPDVTASDQDETIAFLSSAAAFDGEGPVQRIDTHFSVVTLAGNRVLKLKRAVSNDLLDYASPERRRLACEKELAINRRTAPGLYLAVLPVTRERSGGLALDGAGEAVDWVVVMRRFDDDSLFSELARKDLLTTALIDRTADVVARFHGKAEAAPDHGGIDDMRWVVEGNIEALEQASEADREMVAALAEASRAALADHGGLMEQRRKSGHTRRCHGDLHLGNICIFEDQPTLFDAIEFNDRIACCDLLYDLAFLVMDLWARGLHGHANRVINRYLWRTGDWQGLPLLPLFLSCRAAVRAKTSFWAQQVQENGEDAAQRRGEAQAYLQLALQALIRQPPALLALGGLSGTGKTTLAMALAPERSAIPGALVVRSDVLRKQLAGVAFEERLGKEAYGPESNRAVYRKVEGMAGAVLDAGLCAIADAVYLRATQREAIAEVAAHRGLRFDGLWLEAPRHIMTQRVNARSGDASDADSAVVAFQASQVTDAIDWPRLESGSDVESVAVRARSLV
jgi:uncharacterized protein